MTLPQDALFQRFQIHNMDLGGWIRFFTNSDSLGHPDLPFYLSYALMQWFRANPQYRLRFVVPISKEGTTVELYAFYEQHLFADRSGVQSEAGSPNQG
ncbi:MAG TPA: hypothetical protein VH643_08425 [Gemmataceae bacterium]